MLYRYLGKYSEFKCIADKCPDTCCSGWQIVIDSDAYDKYKNDKTGFFKGTIAEAEGEYFFNQQENGDCIFLKNNGLCHMICEKGEEYLCNTCDSYPRHVEEFPGVKEHSLSISCPVVAKQLLEMDSREIVFSQFIDEEKDDDEYDDFDGLLYEKLVACRKEIVDFIIEGKPSGIDVLSNMNIPNVQQLLEEGLSDIEIKKAIISDYMRKLQKSWDADEENLMDFSAYVSGLFECGIDSSIDKIIEKYSKDKAICLNAEVDINSISDNYKPTIENNFIELGLLEMFMKLEPLKVGFRDFVCNAYDWLCRIGKEEYSEAVNSFKASFSNWESYYKNIVLYFIHSYMCGAVYDEYIYSMAMLGFYCGDIITILWTYQFNIIKTEIDCSEILYRFSRELENSNDNMILFEQLIEEGNS